MTPADSILRRWPAIGFEAYTWVPYAEGASRNAVRQHTGPYEAALVPKIQRAALELDGETQALAEEAATVLARTDAVLGSSGVLPLPAVLLRTESASSSQIERLTSSAKSLALAEIDEPTGDNARLVLANVRAMERTLAHQGPVTVESILDVHATLIDPDPHHSSGVRQEQVWIGGKSLGPHRAAFVPSHHSRVGAALDDLVRFCARDDLPVLAHVALAHAQFETIHPFTDGNGRTGRALIHVMLRRAQLVRGATVPISAGLLHDTASYFSALDDYRGGDPLPIVTAVADAAIFASALTGTLVAQIQATQARWREAVSARSDSVVWPLLESLPGNPVVTAELVTRAHGVSAPAVYAAIDRLVDAGVLAPQSAGRRNRAWVAPEILVALDDFADEARRSR